MSDEKPNFNAGSAELLKIMMLTGAIIGVISLFQLWLSMDYMIFGFDYAGYDFILKILNGNEGYSMGYYAYMPLIVFAASVIAVITSVLAFTKREKFGAVAGIILGVIVLISALLYIFYPSSTIMVSNDVAYLVGDFRLMDCLGVGVYSAVFAGIFLIIGGALVLVRRRAVPQDQKSG